MDANLRTYVTPTYLDLPSPVGSVSTRINFLAAKLFEASDGAFLAGRDIYQVSDHIKMMLKYKLLIKDQTVQTWAAEVLELDDDGVEQNLFGLNLLYDSIIASATGQLYGENAPSNPSLKLTSFQQYLRTLQLKGYLLWSFSLDLMTGDPAQSVYPIQVNFSLKFIYL